jgi:hypothetical protein
LHKTQDFNENESQSRGAIHVSAVLRGYLFERTAAGVAISTLGVP